MDVLKISNLHKSFGDKKVLCGLDLTVQENSIFGFVGLNGAGKTTTMKAILGLLRIDEGEISVCGEKVSFGETHTNKFIGYLPDVPEFYSFMTAREYLNLCGESLNMEKAEIQQRSEELLALVGLAGETHRIKGYSRGMKQRLGIAQALLGRPKLLICDEPTSALDPVGRKEILDILLSVKEQTTVLFSTHILTDVERICTDVAFLSNGKIALSGSVEELKRAHTTEGFTLSINPDDNAVSLLSNLEGARYFGNYIFTFKGDEDRMYQILDFVREHKISIRGLERTRSSLESLFMEVVKR